ncbi:MAG: hypothetical protein KDB18_11315 [Salinibacterium sp.]|nr:hypothetical protein [Cryobacterium sp.]MCB1282098.1 hypothetical protein [Salinibacterium sp.]
MKMWFRRRSRARKLKPFDASLLPPQEYLTVAEATEEGLQLTEYASRMAVKNRFITKILADKRPWFIEHSRKDAHDALELLARESDTEAENLAKLIQKFRLNPNSERDAQGYSYDDIDNMEHRREVAVEIARRLRQQSVDDNYLTELVNKARSDAWREVAANIERNLDIEFLPVDADYKRNRDNRMSALINEDLAALIAETGSMDAPTASEDN